MVRLVRTTYRGTCWNRWARQASHDAFVSVNVSVIRYELLRPIAAHHAETDMFVLGGPISAASTPLMVPASR
jgi:hypothetical protein